MRFFLIWLTISWGSASASDFIPLGDIAGWNGPLAVSDDGQVVVGEVSHGVSFRWTAAQGKQLLPVDSWLWARVYDVSSDGSIAAGGVWSLSDDPGILPPHGDAVMWMDDGIASVGTGGYINATANGISSEGRVLAGTFEPGTDNFQSFRWTTDGGFRSLGTLHGGGSEAVDISADGGVVVGASVGLDRWREAYVWTEQEGMQGLGFPLWMPQAYTVATAVSRNGQVVVGTATDLGGALAAWRWSASEGMARLLSKTDPVPRNSRGARYQRGRESYCRSEPLSRTRNFL